MKWTSFDAGRGVPQGLHATSTAKTWAQLRGDLTEFWITTAAQVVKVRNRIGEKADSLVISTRLDSGTVGAYLGNTPFNGAIVTLLRCPLVATMCSRLPDPDTAAFDPAALKLERMLRRELRAAAINPDAANALRKMEEGHRYRFFVDDAGDAETVKRFPMARRAT